MATARSHHNCTEEPHMKVQYNASQHLKMNLKFQSVSMDYAYWQHVN